MSATTTLALVTLLHAAGRLLPAAARTGSAEEVMFGGLVTNVNHLQPGPEGMPESGADLAADLMTKVADAGVETFDVAWPSRSPRCPPARWRSQLADGPLPRALRDRGERCAPSVSLHVPGKRKSQHRGASGTAHIATVRCSKDKPWSVGGGDSALQEVAAIRRVLRGGARRPSWSAFSGREAFARTRARQSLAHQLYFGILSWK